MKSDRVGDGMWRAFGLFLVAVSCVYAGYSKAPTQVATVDVAADPRELVVLVHGMGRTPVSMLPLQRTLENAGYRVVSWGYSSYCCTIEDLAMRLRDDVAASRGAARRVHFVGHSLGNILIRWVLTEEERPSWVGRVVMLAPPNQGSYSADRYAGWLGRVLKPLPELATDSLSTVRRLAVPAGIAVGIIAAEHDGKVTVAQTHLPGETAHVTVPGTHTFIMYRRDVRGMVRAFLRTGQFPSR